MLSKFYLLYQFIFGISECCDSNGSFCENPYFSEILSFINSEFCLSRNREWSAWLYQGKQVIRPNLLQKQSPVQAVPEYAAQYKHIRDMVHMLYEGEVELLLLALENQTEIDYSEPFRVMEFDAADYRRQVRRKEEENRKRLGKKTGLPAFAKEDRITPVITLVLYFGEEEWEKPRSLHDMLKFTEKSEILRPFVPDYPIHVLSVQRDIDISLLHTELKQVIGFLQHLKEGDGLKRYVEENREVFSHLSGAGALFLSAAAKGTKLLKGLNNFSEPQ